VNWMELDGRAVTAEELASLALCNYGHFTSMLVTGGRVRGLSLHLDRLSADCRLLFDHDLDTGKVRELIRRTEVPGSTMVRVTVYAPDLELARPSAPKTPRVLVTTRPAAQHDLPPLRLATVSYRREFAQVKHVGLFGALAYRAGAQRSGVDDVLFVDPTSAVTEGATWNIGFFDDAGRLVWPAGECLPGVTQRLLESAWRAAGREVSRREVRVADSPDLRAAFVANAAVGVRAIAAIDKTEYAVGHPLLPALASLYAGTPAEPV